MFSQSLSACGSARIVLKDFNCVAFILLSTLSSCDVVIEEAVLQGMQSEVIPEVV